MTSRFFAVTGMHRSGTSLVARIVNVLGVNLGPEDAFLPENPDNPRGFWENRQVFELHDQLLASLGGEWDRPPLLEDGWERSPDLAEFHHLAVDLVDTVYGGSEVAAWKDPRGSLLLPFWRTVVDISGTVLCLRHPAEVAASLKKRDGLEPEWSAHLWLRYAVAAYRSDPEHLLIRYNELFEAFDDVVERIAGFLSIGQPDEEEMATAREALDPSLRHHRSVEVPQGPIMERAVAFFELLAAGPSAGTEQVIDSVHESWVLANRLERSPEARMFQLWEELRADYPDIEFPYGRDRDAFGNGPNALAALIPFSPGQEPPAAAEVRRLFGRIGTSLTDRLELAERVAERDRSRGELVEQVSERDRLADELAEQVVEGDRLRGELAERVTEGDQLQDEVIASELKFFTEPGPLFEDFDPAIAADLPPRAKLIAFYLPQFHAIPENDEWWGPGFTEWRNLARGLPRFVGHYQPRIPRDLGFYDLADAEAMRRQIDLARAAGIGGFCFYHYLSDEGPVLEKPLESLLADSTLDIPFCLMWINENWTRTWDELDEDVPIPQTYRADRVDEGDRLRGEVVELVAEGDRLRGEAAGLRNELADMRASTSWRLTAPMRAVGDRSPSLARAGRRFLKLVWWTLTLQIFRRVRDYVRWRRAAHAPSPASDLVIGRAVPASPDPEDRLLGDFARHFADERYIKVDGRPLLIIYRPGLIPNAKETIARWRERLATEFDELPWILMAQGFGDEDPRPFGLDGAVEFPPHKLAGRAPDVTGSLTILDPEFSGNVRSYQDVMVQALLAEESPSYPLIRTVVPSWDNDARRPGRGLTLVDSSPARYEQWLQRTIGLARSHPFANEPLVFVNAWNEWAEAAYLEPDVHFGSAYLNATARALVGESAKVGKRHVLLVGHDAHEHGAQLLLLNLGRCMAGQFGVVVTFLLLEGGGLVDRYREIGEVVIAGPGTPELSRAVEELASGGVQLAVTNTTVSGSVVPELHEAGFRIASLIHELPGLLRERGLEAAAGAIASTSDAVVFPSEIVADGFRSVSEAPVDAAVMLPQGLYHSLLVSDGDGEAVRQDLDIPGNSKIVLGVGYGDLRKGFDLFVAASRIAEREDPDLCFVWVGNVDDAVAHWLLADHQDHGSNLRLVGFIDDVSKYYGAADVLFLSSREDPFPSTVLEAMAAGLPIVGFEESSGSVDLIAEFGQLAEGQNPEAALRAIREVTALQGEAALACAQARRDMVTSDFRFDSYAFALLQLLDPDLQKVSVVVPNYNYARHLEGRLDSIFEQTYPVFEVIVLDDASTDGSVEELERISEMGQRDFSTVVNEDNSGSIMRQWLAGASRGSGDLLWIAEADDLAEPGFLEEMVEAVQSDSVNLAFSDSIQIDAKGEVLADSYRHYFETVDESRFKNNFVMDGPAFLEEYLSVKNLILNVSSVLFRRSTLVEVLQTDLEELAAYSFAGDWQVYASLCMTGRVAFVADSQNIHRRHEESATHRAEGTVHVREIGRVHSFIADTVDLNGPALDRQAEYRRTVGRQLGVEA